MNSEVSSSSAHANQKTSQNLEGKESILLRKTSLNNASMDARRISCAIMDSDSDDRPPDRIVQLKLKTTSKTHGRFLISIYQGLPGAKAECIAIPLGKLAIDEISKRLTWPIRKTSMRPILL